MRSTLASFPLAALTLAGCFAPNGGLDGQWSSGELGRTRWQISDGLCPGLGGGCALDVPLAEGARTTLEIDGVDGAELTASVTGSLASGGAVLTGEGENARLEVVAVGTGAGHVEISDASGVVDRASLEVRRATVIECGLWPRAAGALSWEMEDLEAVTELALPFVGPEENNAIQLACRASDDAGALLTADAITWEVIEGSEVLLLAETGLIVIPSVSASGARLDYRTPGRGVARVRASIGDVSTELAITVE